MAEVDATAELGKLIGECDAMARRAKTNGRLYYLVGYFFMLLSVGGSIGAGVLALWTGVDRALVGTIALLPALCGIVAGQLRLVEKGNWFYLRHREASALGRKVIVARKEAPNTKTLDACYTKLSDLEKRMGEMWAQDLSFSFAKPVQDDSD